MKLLTSLGGVLLLLCNCIICTQAQTMNNLFLKLPVSCTPGMCKNDRDMLVQKGEYIVGQSCRNMVDYSIDTVTDNYLSYEYSCTKWEGSYASFEIKEFKTTEGKNILLFSKNSDTKSTATEFDLQTYLVTDSSLVENNRDFFPDKLDYSVFLKKNTPDSIRATIQKTSLCTFDLDMKANDKIIFYIVLDDANDAKWLAGNVMMLTWTGNGFTGAVSYRKDVAFSR